jgi:N-sulfoglucosamine sulfohydrolase
MESAAADDERMAERLRMYLHRTPQEFYDLTADPGERRNLIADPARQHEIEQMKSLLLEQMRSTGDPLTDAFTAKTSE